MAEPEHLSTRTKLSKGGRIVIPARFRNALGLAEGDDVIVRLEGGEIRITSVTTIVQSAQEKVRRHIPEGRSLAEELIAERRQEAVRE